MRNLSRTVTRALVLSLGLAGAAGCSFVPGASAPADQGGAVIANDRTTTGQSGEKLLTGDMIVAPYGTYALLQRNTVSVLVDMPSGGTRELPFQVDRFVFAKQNPAVGFALDPQKGAVVAFDLASGSEQWRTNLPSSDVALFRISDDDASLVVAEGDRVVVLDAASGQIRGSTPVASRPSFLAFVPAKSEAIVVGTAQWTDHKPATALTAVDLGTTAASSVTVPNCEAPIKLLPDGTRGFLSPTFCAENTASTDQGTWTNPDPVSVVDLDAAGLHFVKNLPGFGPVAMDGAGRKVVAYLDTKRVDASMFDDARQIPPAGGDEYHLLVIDPLTLKFSVTPIGNELPRFAMTADGKGLLVDASVRVQRLEAKASVTVDPSGVRASASGVFGSDAPFGYFDLTALQYQAFQGPVAALDRFVQTGDGRVFTLKTSSDGLGGDLYGIDLSTRSTVDLHKSLRDIGVLPDGKTLLLRIRLAAVTIDGGLYTQEEVCLSTDGATCSSVVTYRSTQPVSTCSDADCCGATSP